LSVTVVTSIEIVSGLAFFRLEPPDDLVGISMAVELDLGPWMQRARRIEAVAAVNGTGGRGSAMDGSAVESDCPQLVFSQECPAATAGNWAISVSQPCQFSNWQAH
jgi:hypothetical protein